MRVNYWKPPVSVEEKTHLCGAVDVGITPLAVEASWSTTRIQKHCTGKLRRWQRALERRTVGSRGWREAQQRINAIHRRINGLRDNAHHQLSRLLVRKYAVLAIESLNVAGMDKLPRQAKAIRDAAIAGLLRRSVTCGDRGTRSVFPSTLNCYRKVQLTSQLERID